jgi:hypothetical protein
MGEDQCHALARIDRQPVVIPYPIVKFGEGRGAPFEWAGALAAAKRTEERGLSISALSPNLGVFRRIKLHISIDSYRK